MKGIDILLISIRLLYLEKSIEEHNSSNSVDLVKDILNLLDNTKKPLDGNKANVLNNLKDFVRNMADNFENSYDPNLLKQSLLLILENKDLIDELIKDITKDMPLEDKQKRILRLRGLLNTFYGEDKLAKTLNELSYKITKGRNSIKDINVFRMEALAKIESIKTGNIEEDANIITEIDLGDTNSTSEIIHDLQDEENNGFLLKTGFQALNLALDGGIRRGELIKIESQQHHYKSGLTRSLFMQTMTENKPLLQNKKKKPLMVYFSFEDNARLVLKFMYEYLTIANGDPKKINNISSNDAALYIKNELERNGWTVKLLVVNPSGWGYKDIFNTIEKYESKGYEVFGVALDYLSLVPRVGCITTGPTGTDLRDLFRRVGNYGRAKDIYIMTPHQSSSGVKNLLRNGVSDVDLLKELYAKGYSDGSTAINQEVDVSILGHIAYVDGEAYYTMAIDKHRGHVLDPKKVFINYKFPKGNFPIPPDLNKEDSCIKDLDNVSSDDFI